MKNIENNHLEIIPIIAFVEDIMTIWFWLK